MILRIFFVVSYFLGFGLNLSYAMDEESEMNGGVTLYTYESLSDEEQEEIYEKYIDLIISIHEFKLQIDPNVLDFLVKSKNFLLWFMDSGCSLFLEEIKDLNLIMNINTKSSTNSSSEDA